MVMDVTCCTASILHLVAIAIDRYWAVTRLNYIRSRNTRSIVSMIIVVWIVSLAISLPTRFHANRNAVTTNTSSCDINDDKTFTIFSTVGAFYLPMCFLMAVYLKIYQTAHLTIRKKHFRQNTTSMSAISSSKTRPTEDSSSRSIQRLSRGVGDCRHCLFACISCNCKRRQACNNKVHDFCLECSDLQTKHKVVYTSSYFSEPSNSQSSSSPCCKPPCCHEALSTTNQINPHELYDHPSLNHHNNMYINQTTNLNVHPDIGLSTDCQMVDLTKTTNVETSALSFQFVLPALVNECVGLPKNNSTPSISFSNSLESLHRSLPLSTTHSDLSQLRFHKVESLSTEATEKASSWNSPNESLSEKLSTGAEVQADIFKIQVLLKSPYFSESEHSSVTGVQRLQLKETTEGERQCVINKGMLHSHTGSVALPYSPYLVSSGSIYSGTQSNSPGSLNNRSPLQASPTVSCSSHLDNSYKSCKEDSQAYSSNEGDDVKVCPWMKQSANISSTILNHNQSVTEPVSVKQNNDIILEVSANSADIIRPVEKCLSVIQTTFSTSTTIYNLNSIAPELQTDFSRNGDGKSINALVVAAEHNRERLENRRERKAVRTLAIITGCFILCWLPFFVGALLDPLCDKKCDIPLLAKSIFLWLGYLNSLLNPILYTVFAPDFRNAFKKIIYGRFTCR